MENERNWAIYNQRLVERGSVEFFLDERLIETWEAELCERNQGKVGHPFWYTESFVRALHQMKCIFRLPYRQLTGFASSLVMATMGVDVPHFTSIQKRLKNLDMPFIPPVFSGGRVVAIDATGVKVVNSGEWISRYGKQKHWVKLHVVVDTLTHKFIVTKVTKEHVADTKMFPELISQTVTITKVKKVLADAAYDSELNFRQLKDLGAQAGIRLRLINKGRWLKDKRAKRQAIIDQFGITRRNGRKYAFTNIEEAQKDWKRRTGFGQRWQVESSFASFKGMFGEHVYSKNWEAIQKEIQLKTIIYNNLI